MQQWFWAGVILMFLFEVTPAPYDKFFAVLALFCFACAWYIDHRRFG